MGRYLTNRYSLLFEKKGIKNPFSFINDGYKYGKLRELVSFIVWELSHKLRLFPNPDDRDLYKSNDNGESTIFHILYKVLVNVYDR